MPIPPEDQGPGPLNIGRIRCRNVRVKRFDEATLVVLETAVNDWLAERGEEVFMYIVWNHDHPDYSALIVYVEE